MLLSFSHGNHFFERVILEIQSILQQNVYKLMWHPMWKVSHQQLKHNSALTFNCNIFYKKKTFNINKIIKN
jgi:uncharacterized protein YueI